MRFEKSIKFPFPSASRFKTRFFSKYIVSKARIQCVFCFFLCLFCCTFPSLAFPSLFLSPSLWKTKRRFSCAFFFGIWKKRCSYLWQVKVLEKKNGIPLPFFQKGDVLRMNPNDNANELIPGFFDFVRINVFLFHKIIQYFQTLRSGIELQFANTGHVFR